MEKINLLLQIFTDRKFLRYLLVGGTTFTIDFILFVILHSVFNWDVLLANTVSYWSSIVFNFSMNHSWTFNGNTANFKRNILLYAILLVFNFSFTSLFLTITISMGLNPQLAKVFATGLQTVWTYITYKKVIFK